MRTPKWCGSSLIDSANSRARAVASLGFALLAMTVGTVAAQETCTSVDVRGVDYSGTYEKGSSSDAYSAEGTSYILQPVAIGDSRRRSLALAEVSAAGGADVGALFRGREGRSLADDEPCATQMWILADSAELVNGYPYYAAFDCAEYPSNIDSTWVYISCADCAQESTVTVVCSVSLAEDSTSGDGSDSDGGILTTPAIAGIAAGAVLLCLALGCCVWRVKKSGIGSSSFADDSDHSATLKANGGADNRSAGGRTPSLGAGTSVTGGGGGGGSGASHTAFSATDPTVSASRASVKGAHVAPMAARNPPNFKVGHDASGSYDGAYSSRPGSINAAAGAGAKDSMAAAAAAAVAAANAGSAGRGGQQHPAAAGFVVEQDGAGVANPVHGKNIVWSAGQDFDEGDNFREGRGGGRMGDDYGDDSAAASDFSLNPDNVPDRSYYEDAESMPASSPGGYSMYSHFTAGGHTVYTNDNDGIDLDMEWAGEDAHSHNLAQARAKAAYEQARGHRSGPPPPTYDESGADRQLRPAKLTDVPLGQQRPRRGSATAAPTMLSPAGHIARADNHGSGTGKHMGRGPSREDMGFGDRR